MFVFRILIMMLISYVNPKGEVNAVSTVRPLHEWMRDTTSLCTVTLGSAPPTREELLGPVKCKEAMALLGSADADGLISLCVETVLRDDKSVIVFCPTKKWCDRAAAIVAQVRYAFFLPTVP